MGKRFKGSIFHVFQLTLAISLTLLKTYIERIFVKFDMWIGPGHGMKYVHFWGKDPDRILDEEKKSSIFQQHTLVAIVTYTNIVMKIHSLLLE